MPRPIFHHNPKIPYHLSGRCINREWFTNIDFTWHLFEDYLFLLSSHFGAQIYAFVLMNNHFHLMARFPLDNMSEGMAYFMRETSKQMTKASGRVNSTWGSRFFRSAIMSPHYYLLCYKYVYRNPVEAGMAKNAELYPYSTLHGILGFKTMSIPMVFDDTLFSDVEGTMSWINHKPNKEDLSAVKQALRRPTFRLPRDRKTRKLNRLENDLL